MPRDALSSTMYIFGPATKQEVMLLFNIRITFLTFILGAALASAWRDEVSGRGSVLLSGQLAENLDTLAVQRRQVQEQIEQALKRIEVLKEQLDEDGRMESALQAQIKKMQDGRDETVRALQSSLREAHEQGRDEISKGFGKSDEVEVVDTDNVQGVDTDSVPVVVDTVSVPENVETLPGEGTSSTTPESFLQLGEKTEDAIDPEDLGEVYPILTSNAERVEKQHEMLMDQREKVHITIQHTQLTIAKLKDDLKLFEVMKSAVKGQIDELDKGERSAITRMFETLKSESAAQNEVLKTLTAKEEATSTTLKAQDQVEPVEDERQSEDQTTSTTQAA